MPIIVITAYGNLQTAVKAGGAVLPEHLSPPVDAELIQGAGDGSVSFERLHELLHHWSRKALQNPARSSPAYEKLLQFVEPPLLKAAME